MKEVPYMKTNIHFLLLAEVLLDIDMFQIISNSGKCESFVCPPQLPEGL